MYNSIYYYICIYNYSWPFISVSSASADSTNHESNNIWGKKNSIKLQKAKLEFAVHWQLFP